LLLLLLLYRLVSFLTLLDDDEEEDPGMSVLSVDRVDTDLIDQVALDFAI
jgi:hypothetical protein